MNLDNLREELRRDFTVVINNFVDKLVKVYAETAKQFPNASDDEIKQIVENVVTNIKNTMQSTADTVSTAACQAVREMAVVDAQPVEINLPEEEVTNER